MTISSATRRAGPFAGNGVATVFPFSFKVFDKTDVAVAVVDAFGNQTVLTLDSEYSVTLNGDQNANPGGAITYPLSGSPLPTGSSLATIGSLLQLQPTDITNNGDFYPTIVEDAFDRSVILIQQLSEQLGRQLVVPVTDSSPSVELPTSSQRANKGLGFDAAGNPIVIDLTIGSVLAPVVSSIAILRFASKFLTTDVFVTGYYAASDGGGGAYHLDPTDHASVDNGGTIIVAADGGRWKLQVVLTATLKQFGCKIDGTTDDTAPVQRAVTAMYRRKLRADPGKCKITAEIDIVGQIVFEADPNLFTFLLATHNQSGLMIGDGTSETRTAVFSTTISNINFNPFPGVAAFTNGACIELNSVAFVDVINCTFFGLDGATKKLFDGVFQFQASECNITKCTFSQLLGTGASTTGSAGVENRTVDGRIDFCEFTNITGVCVYFGANTAGMTLNYMVAFSNSTWAIQVDAAAGASGQNFFIEQPDIEVDTPNGGVLVSQGANVEIVSGWIGAGTGVVGGVGLRVDAAANGVACTGVRFDQLQVILSGQACEIVGGEVNGDNATMPVGITVNSTATDTNIVGVRIRQWTQYGINFVGAPFRCNVSGVLFKDIGILEILGADAVPTSNAPNISSCQSDAAFTMAAAATLPLRFGREFVQVTGATAISAMQSLGPGGRVTIQAGAGGLSWTNAAHLQLKGGVNAAQSAFSIIDFVSDGQTWYEAGRSF